MKKYLFTLAITLISSFTFNQTISADNSGSTVDIDLSRQKDNSNTSKVRRRTAKSPSVFAWIEEGNLYLLSDCDLYDVIIDITDEDGIICYSSINDLFADEANEIDLSTLMPGKYHGTVKSSDSTYHVEFHISE